MLFFLRAASLYSIRAGSTSRATGGVVVNVARVINNPSYNSKTMDNDVSVLKLASALTTSTSIQAIKLHDRGQDVPDGANTVVSG